MADAVGGAQVGPERRLAVGSRRHELEPAAGAEQAGAEAGHHVAALVFEGHRRHRHEDVVRQEGHQRVEIGGLPRAGEPRHDRLLGGRVGDGCRFAIGGRRLLVLQAGAGPFEGAGDRFDGRVQHVGHLARVKTQDVAQDEDRDLAGRQHLQRGHERQRDRFGLLIDGLRAARHIDRTVEEGVGEWLEPDDLAEPGRLGRFNIGHVPLLSLAPAG